MADTILWDVSPLEMSFDVGDLNIQEVRQLNGTAFIYGYDHGYGKVVDGMAEGTAFLIEAPMNGADSGKMLSEQTRFFKANLGEMIANATERVNLSNDVSIKDAMEQQARTKANVTVETEKIYDDAPDQGTTLHFSKDGHGGVDSSVVHEKRLADMAGDLSQKFLQRAGVAGGVVAAGIAATTGANAQEIAANAVPGGQSVLALSEGNGLEALYLGIEETGVGSILTEIARPISQALGADVESGILQDVAALAAAGFAYDPNDYSAADLEDQQRILLQNSGLPEQMNGYPLVEALRIPENHATIDTAIENLGNSYWREILTTYDQLEIERQAALEREQPVTPQQPQIATPAHDDKGTSVPTMG